MSKNSELLYLYHEYKRETGKTEVQSRDVALYAQMKGVPLPPPIDPIERLASQISDALREEIRHDEFTGRPYRVNHAYKTRQGDQQITLWVEIDEAPRPIMLKCFVQRREQIVGDVCQLAFDFDRWNRVHPDEEPIDLPKDFTDDVEWRKAGEQKAS